MDTDRRSQRFRQRRNQILFTVASVIWAAVMISTGSSAWPIAMWLTTALIPYSLSRQRTEAAESDASAAAD